MFEKKRWCLIRSTSEAHMRNHWTLTPSEMALFIAAVTFLAGGFMIATGG
jgi:hypothetical protein